MDMNMHKNAEIEEFLNDVRTYFRASLETSEYENASNIFHVTAAEHTIKLLARCEHLLGMRGTVDDQTAVTIKSNGLGDCVDSKLTSNAATTSSTATTATTTTEDMAETGCYLEMKSPTAQKNSLSNSREYIDFTSNASLDSDKTFRCSSTQPAATPVSATNAINDDNNDKMSNEQQLYDICQSLADDETERAITTNDHDLANTIDCPYVELPAGHLAIQRSTKYGQLQRIEKRLFFDQSKKCYCGIIGDWMLSYAEGPTACRPSSILYLKSSAIEIEHFGEGKRREVCFQITTADPNKKFIYQASNEVDAKEWIHAIEAAIRGDVSATLIATISTKSPRKLPTPPVTKKSSFASCSVVQRRDEATDSIYEEPSPIYNGIDTITPPRLPDKCNSPNALAKRFEYDIPKCPPQPLLTELETSSTTDMNSPSLLITTSSGAPELKPQPSSLHGLIIKSEFQNKVKTVHSELSNQLTAGGPSPERLKKAAIKTYSCGSSDSEMLSLTNSPPHAFAMKDKKKQRNPSASAAINTPKSPKDCDKLAKNWFLSRLNKTTGLGTRATNSTASNTPNTPTNAKCKQSEKENLLKELDLSENYDGGGGGGAAASGDLPSSTEAKSKVNMIINQFESSGHLSTMFSVEALAANALASLTSFCESDNFNNYEPIMNVSTPPSSFLKKV